MSTYRSSGQLAPALVRKWFIPEAIVRGGDDAIWRARRLISASAVGLVGLLYLAIAVLGGGKPREAIFFAVATGGVLLTPVTLRTTGSLRAAASQLVASVLIPVILLAANTSGLTLPELVWLAPIPLLGTAVVGRRFAIGWTAIALAGIGALGILDRLRWNPISGAAAPWTRAGAALGLTCVLGVLLGLSLDLDRQRSEACEAVAQARAAFDGRVRNLTHRINNPLQYITSNMDYLSLVLFRPRSSSAFTAEEKEELKTAIRDLRRGVEQARDVVGELLAPVSPAEVETLSQGAQKS